MNEKIVVKAKENSDDTYSTDYVMEVFEKSTDLNLIKAVVEKASDRLYASWASVDAIDKASEKIPIEDIIKNQKTLLKRGAPIIDSHSNITVGKTISFKVLQHPTTKTLGVLHLNKIYDDNLKDNEVWNKIKSGEYKGSSVGGYSTNSEIKYEDNKLFKTLIGFEQFETSAVAEPCNPFALNESFSVVAKSAHNTETDSKVSKLSDEEIQLLKKMVKENKTETKKEESVLDMIMSKVSSGEELSESESKALGAAIDAAQSSMASEDNSEEEKQEESEEETTEESNTEKEIQSLKERLDLIEEAISGNTDKEYEEEEEKESEEEEETEKSKKTKSEEEETEKSSEVSALKKEIEELKKSLKESKKEDIKESDAKEVVKGERPKATAKSHTFTSLDIATGRAVYNAKTGKIEARNK